jgi:N-acyl-L-homoserine lactone synthetase
MDFNNPPEPTLITYCEGRRFFVAAAAARASGNFRDITSKFLGRFMQVSLAVALRRHVPENYTYDWRWWWCEGEMKRWRKG